MSANDLLDFLHIYKARTLHDERTGDPLPYYYQASTKALEELERWPRGWGAGSKFNASPSRTTGGAFFPRRHFKHSGR